MEVVDIETALDAYEDYRMLKEELEEAKEELRNIEDSNKDIRYHLSILSALEYATKKNYGRYDEVILRFLNEHKELEEYQDLKYYINNYIKDISFLESSDICNLPLSQFILLEKSDRKYLVNLSYLNMQDVTEFNPELVEFIIKLLKNNGYFIGKVESSDLPLLMNIKEDLEGDKRINEYDNIDYCFSNTISYSIASEFENAKVADQKLYSKRDNLIIGSCPFVLDSNDVQNKWQELDELEPNISKEEYLLRYYKLLLIFGNDVEKVYCDAPDDEKKYVLDAYQFYSSDVLKLGVDKAEKMHHFRTVSPLINVEILKRKMLIKK